ncbi:ABC transporter substrate-binding protein [Advenella kashmirensis W13003]|uniref:ABC transporter substrate-binding protein n=1 Tax=Advenella kashmirensis W13003 TaxID=1424334 RepID=V8QYF7_9BURK|nr:tripartite tricarboxylate transporter substrate binding protein [Advenella kashmirensis]ETF04418.1 ABC transporter substrate-binding protein [Advenella kashmirensis W13003]
MTLFRRTALIGASLLAFGASTAHAQEADTYPNKPIKIVVPYSPGGFTDILARQMSQQLSQKLSQPVVVENKPGAGTIIGAETVARAKPDGYTLLMAVTTTLSSNPHLFSKLPYKVSDFKPIALTGLTPFVLVANPSVPANNVRELIELARKEPGKLSGATLGNGSSTHLVLSMLRGATGADILDVPYKGASPASTDLVAGHVDLFFDAITTSLPHIKEGRLKAIAMTSEKRSEAAPSIPTFREEGVPEMLAYSWYGLLAPAGTPDAITEKLNKVVNEALASPEIQEKFRTEGAESRPMSAKAFGDLIEEHSQIWGKVIKSLNIRLD